MNYVVVTISSFTVEGAESAREAEEMLVAMLDQLDGEQISPIDIHIEESFEAPQR